MNQADLLLPNRDERLSTERQRGAWKEIVRIMDSPSYEEPLDDFRTEIRDRLAAEELLRSNVFSFHHEGSRVGIQSRPPFCQNWFPRFCSTRRP